MTARRLLLAVIAVIGVAAIATAAVSLGWIAIGGGPLGLQGLIALSLGALGTVGLTWALMALAFKSSREGWDDRPSDPDRP
jgi:hypothetical protein